MLNLLFRVCMTVAAVLPLLPKAGYAAHYAVFDPKGSVATYPVAVNEDNEVAGYYSDSAAKIHSFLREAKRQHHLVRCGRFHQHHCYGH